jgi:2-hydroxychromene-2-carboxylate isomerase
MSSDRFTFYFDLRCPFCFVERERIGALGLGKAITYQSVRHERDLPVPARAPTPDEGAMIAREIEVLIERAPEIPLSAPPIWPSTLPAARALAAMVRTGEGDVDAFVEAISRALWREGRDPSNPLVVGAALRAAGAAGLTPNTEDDATLTRWQLDWTRREERTPTIVSPHGVALVGLATERRLEAFLRSGRLGDETADVCATDVQPKGR